MILNALRDIFPRSGWKSFLKGRAKSTAESLLMMPNTLAMGFTLATPSGKLVLPLIRRYAPPSPGGRRLKRWRYSSRLTRKVSGRVRSPLGELVRERLRGRGKTLTALPERVKKVGQKRPQAFLTHK